MIDQLTSFPADMPIIVDGHEGGYEALEANRIYFINVCYPPSEDYYGDFQKANLRPAGSATPIKIALILSRENKEQG